MHAGDHLQQMSETEDGMRLILLHYHTLKNAGSTIMEILGRSFWDAFSAFDLADSDAEIKHQDLFLFLERNPGLKAVSSHQIFYPVPRAPGFLFFDVCFLRDPIDRIRSTYDYFRIKPVERNTISELANQHTLAEFVRCLLEEMPWTVNNVQVNLLANGLVHDHPRGAEDLDIATTRMLETSFLGVVDQFDESMVAGQYRLSVLFPALNCIQTPVNDSAKPGSTLAERLEQFRKACDEDVYAELLRLNGMDFELLRRARDEVRRRFEVVPDREGRLRRLREGVARLRAGEEHADVSKGVPKAVVRRKAPSAALNTPAPGALTSLMRGLRFAANLRMMRPGSAFRRLFDANYYRDIYPDVAASGADPFWHFVTTGAFEGRNPHPLFDTNFYLSQCPRSESVNALSDYLEHGDAGGRKPHPLFDSEYYLRCHPEVRQAGMNSLFHYLLHGAAEGRKPNLLFQPDYYVSACPAAGSAPNPLVHFVETEAGECSRPHPLFDGLSYLRAHREVSGNPLAHYLTRPQVPHRPCEVDVGGFDTARLTIQEVDVLIVFAGSGFDAFPEPEQERMYASLQAWAGHDGFPGEIALVWRTRSGEKKFLSAPQQQPFFECVRYDQLAAQINGEKAG